MKRNRTALSIGLLSELLLVAMAMAVSLSPTTITISQPVHFLSPEGTDILVNPGNYEIEAEGNTLRLQPTDIKEPIRIQAGPAPFPDEVDSPVAIAIPIPEEGIYVALAVSKEPGLEAMGSYSGIHTRGATLLQTRKTLSDQQRSRLKSLAGRLRQNPASPDIEEQLQIIARQRQGQNPTAPSGDINALIFQVLRQSYLETNKDLQFFAAKIKSINEQKKQLREQIREIRENFPQPTSAPDKQALGKKKKALEQKLKELEDQESLTNFEIQDLMSRYNQAEQTASRIRKKQDDAQSTAIKKIN